MIVAVPIAKYMVRVIRSSAVRSLSRSGIALLHE